MSYTLKDKYYLDIQSPEVKSPVDYPSSSANNTLSTSKENTAKANNAYFSKHVSPIILIACAISVTYFSFTGRHGLLYLEKLNNELIDISDENAQLIENISELSYKIEAINEGGLYLEKKAREDFGLFREGETVYLFKDLDKSKKPS